MAALQHLRSLETNARAHRATPDETVFHAVSLGVSLTLRQKHDHTALRDIGPKWRIVETLRRLASVAGRRAARD